MRLHYDHRGRYRGATHGCTWLIAMALLWLAAISVPFAFLHGWVAWLGSFLAMSLIGLYLLGRAGGQA